MRQVSEAHARWRRKHGIDGDVVDTLWGKDTEALTQIESDLLWEDCIGPTCTVVFPYHCDTCAVTWSEIEKHPCDVYHQEDDREPEDGETIVWPESTNRCTACCAVHGYPDDDEAEA